MSALRAKFHTLSAVSSGREPDGSAKAPPAQSNVAEPVVVCSLLLWDGNGSGAG